ncbi:MAG: D-alanine--D-alanine ligase [Candidatus Kerfeldbacteria bacterium]|nr:D-alanine--D-alanine ligase [Candidatus Kerfeldbacteria bacterium]
MAKKLRVAVVMGGPSAEYEISLQSGKTIAQHLNVKKYEVMPIVIDRRRRWLPAPRFLTSGRIGTRALMPTAEPKRRPFDVALLALHSFGEDGTVQGFLETLGVPYTGSGVLASALAMDKKRFKTFCQTLNLLLAGDVLVTAKAWRQSSSRVLKKIQALGAKVVVKPNDSGSSAGTSIVETAEPAAVAEAVIAAWRVSRTVLVEEYLRGRELTVATLGDETKVRALPVIEIVPTKDAFFSYRVKYDGSTKEICPARISRRLARQLSEMAIKVHVGIGASGVIRTDFIMVRGRPYILETNTLPGMTPESLVPKAARVAGISYGQLLDTLIKLSLQRHRRPSG